ncbi:endonuclease-reverse transcriptase [Elysia marginata]|uniref:Endonuclease-reverse transcriptase n=1 Tax=Elysia marginata TaxID=1093978 RepID=A0AAV4HP17_9GAST|nr:endonuclease-reverse transcriptase [Elysia marginata]
MMSKAVLFVYLSLAVLAKSAWTFPIAENEETAVVAYVGPQEPLLATVKRRKLAWFGHVTRHDSLSKTILQGTVEGKHRRGRQKKAWCDKIKEWTGMAMYELPEIEMHGDRKLILLPSDPPDDPTGRGTE